MTDIPNLIELSDDPDNRALQLKLWRSLAKHLDRQHRNIRNALTVLMQRRDQPSHEKLQELLEELRRAIDDDLANIHMAAVCDTEGLEWLAEKFIKQTPKERTDA
jgi:hypothetical protein